VAKPILRNDIVFAIPPRSAYDWNWTLFGIPVRVHPFFWLAAALMGLYALELGAVYFVIWVLCFFVSLLIHELGHVLAGRYFGAHGQVLLYGFGGLAIGSTNLSKRWQRIIVYSAGPLAEIGLFGLAWLGIKSLDPGEDSHLLGWTLWVLFFINLFWGGLNLLPVWPLDGGQISREVCIALNSRRGSRISLIISIATAGLLVVNALSVISTKRSLIPGLEMLKGPWLVLFFGLLGYNSYRALQFENSRHS